MILDVSVALSFILAIFSPSKKVRWPVIVLSLVLLELWSELPFGIYTVVFLFALGSITFFLHVFDASSFMSFALVYTVGLAWYVVLLMCAWIFWGGAGGLDLFMRGGITFIRLLLMTLALGSMIEVLLYAVLLLRYAFVENKITVFR